MTGIDKKELEDGCMFPKLSDWNLSTLQIDCVGVKQHVNPCGHFVLFPREREKRDR